MGLFTLRLNNILRQAPISGDILIDGGIFGRTIFYLVDLRKCFFFLLSTFHTRTASEVKLLSNIHIK